MAWWIYKCNSRKGEHKFLSGDWNDFFERTTHGKRRRVEDNWGSVEIVPALRKLHRGDMVIAHQTDRNELVGVAKVGQSCHKDGFLHLDPVEEIRVKVRPLKNADPKIASIPALQPGPIKTVYEITATDADRLLRAARKAADLKD
ncbi:MAG: hypothetical protein JJU36_02120 [Phycisphaeraceae bacterium]|nr:hypothetical protein [Phycisphaeraceae bacterium]